MLSWLLTCPFSAPKSVLHTLFWNFYVLNSFASWLPVSSCKPEVPKECWKERGGFALSVSFPPTVALAPTFTFFQHLQSEPHQAAWVVPVEFWAPVPQGPSLAFQGTGISRAASPPQVYVSALWGPFSTLLGSAICNLSLSVLWSQEW